MKEAFDIPSRLVYPFKQSYDEYKHEGLNLFLEKMYKVALREGYLEFKDPVQAFNTAYYIASALYATPHLDLRVMTKEVDYALRAHLSIDNSTIPFPPGFPSSKARLPLTHEMLVRWMVYAILFLQDSKTEAMDEYLEGYRMRLQQWGAEVYEGNEEEIGFVGNFPDMIDSCNERFHTDLYPNIKVDQLNESDWKNTISKYDEQTIDLLMTFFRTKEEQHAFLDWMYKLDDDLPF